MGYLVSVPRALREKLGDEGSDALVQLINAAQDRQERNLVETVAARFEKRLTEETSAVRRELNDVKTFLFKWMFVFWLGQIGAVVALRLVGVLS